MTVLLVAVGAAGGAAARYLTDSWARARFGSGLPVGTLLVNTTGSLVLGLLVGAAAGRPLLALLGVGFCGALTTYSTFGYETVRLFTDRSALAAVLNAAANIAAGLAAALTGVLIGVHVGVHVGALVG